LSKKEGFPTPDVELCTATDIDLAVDLASAAEQILSVFGYSRDFIDLAGKASATEPPKRYV